MVVAVVGAGNGGHATAGALALAGHHVRLHDIVEAAVAPVATRGGIDVTGVAGEGFAQLEYAGTDLGPALRDAEAIVLVVPGDAQAQAVAQLAPLVSDGVVVLLHPGGTGGALECARVLRQGGCDAAVGETDAFAFGCRLPEPGRSHITAVKARLRVGVVPAEDRERVLAATRELFPRAEAASSALETSLANMNAVLHVGPMLANAGRVEQAEQRFEFYGQGITPSVARLIERIDAERVAVAEALGVPTRTLLEWIEETYGVTRATVYEAVQALNREVYGGSPAPESLGHRYLTEDVAAGLVPLEALARSAGVAVPAVGALVTIASAALGRDLRGTGRTAERMGLAPLDGEGLAAVGDGERMRRAPLAPLTDV